MIDRLLTRICDKINPAVYYCNALSGNSNYNICINSDMTVSCNCQDFEGQGQIGDLNKQSFEDIFFGETAQSFRKKLASGMLPIALCKHCSELRKARRLQVWKYMGGSHIPNKGVMVENNVLCNLKCAYCPSQKVSDIRKEKVMSLVNMEKVAAILCKYRMKELFFHNLGEPFMFDSVYEQLAVIRSYNPDIYIYTSTNGMLLDSDDKRRAAMLMNHIFISIDGASQQAVGKYQVGANFEKQYANMMDIVRFRNNLGAYYPVIEWKYVVFSWNDSNREIERAIELAKQADVDIISFAFGAPFYGGGAESVSKRYHQDSFFQNIGKRTDRGFEIDFRSIQQSAIQ